MRVNGTVFAPAGGATAAAAGARQPEPLQRARGAAATGGAARCGGGLRRCAFCWR